MIGINNRDIRCFEKDGGTVTVTEELSPLIQHDAVIVSESGIETPHDLKRALAHAHAALIGTSLMQSASLPEKMHAFMGVSL
jgi:indole-3-glycerol phosphate synthase